MVLCLCYERFDELHKVSQLFTVLPESAWVTREGATGAGVTHVHEQPRGRQCERTAGFTV